MSLQYHKYDTDKLTICTMGDEHIGSKFHNRDEHLRNIEWAYENEVPLILMGDEMETATKTSIGAGVFEQTEIVQEQLEDVVSRYAPLAEKGLILGVHLGNHEARVMNSSGANLSKILATMLNTKYLGAGAVHYFKVGNQGYTMYTTHGNSASTLAHTKIKAAIKMSDMVDCEIYAMGHVHALDHHVRNFYKPNLRKKTIDTYQKHFIITGSYLNHWGSYAHTKAYVPSKVGSPKIKLGGEKKSIRVSLG